MTQKDVSIEYAHIYTNTKVDEEHQTSVNILHDVVESLHKRNQSTALVILVDDYSFPDPTFNYDELIQWLSGRGYKPDLMFRESQLIPLCDLILTKLNDYKLKGNIVDYIKNKKYP